jgi:hypothetical protein
MTTVVQMKPNEETQKLIRHLETERDWMASQAAEIFGTLVVIADDMRHDLGILKDEVGPTENITEEVGVWLITLQRHLRDINNLVNDNFDDFSRWAGELAADPGEVNKVRAAERRRQREAD